VPSLSIPDIVIRRLPLYLRALIMLGKQGQTITSSHELGSLLDLSPAQIRKDLSYFGEFGKQGMGYEVEFLTSQLKRILQVNHGWEVAVVGVGDLGRALISHSGFRRWKFRVVAVFDKDPHIIGKSLGNLTVRDVSDLHRTISRLAIQLAIIAVPAEEAQTVADSLVEAGVKAILNYAPACLTVPQHVHIQSVDPVACLQSMTYYLEEPS
jgi:redox-sensing transcriptional repressor